MAWALFQYMSIVVLIVSKTFASEATAQNSEPALVLVVGMRNILLFIFTYNLTPMEETHGYK